MQSCAKCVQNLVKLRPVALTPNWVTIQVEQVKQSACNKMAEAELSLNYREGHVAVAHGLLLLSVPVVSLFVLLCSLSVWMQTGAQGANISLFLCSLFALLLLTILGLLLTSDRTVFCTRDGISVPFVLCPRFSLRSNFSWSSLVAIRLIPGAKHGSMELSFKDGSRITLNLNLLPETQIENLIVCMDVWCGGVDTFPALLEARVRLKEQSGELELPGYTEMWEDELARRFGPTNFIPLEPGQQVGEYKVERQLAFGGLSALYEVSNKNHEHGVLKEAVIPSDAEESLKLSAEKMLDRESTILSSLSHPNIARVNDNFLHEGRHYLLMELIEGEDLRRLVKEHGPQSETAVIAWSLQLIEALSYLHSQNPPVIHRDLSPDNLMLRESGEICIIDFGAANHFLGTATGTMIGKQAYIAPEQLRGKAEPASDIYAFGGTLFFLLTGKDPEALSVAHPREYKSSISAQLDGLIADCTHQEPEQRPSGNDIKRRLLLVQKATNYA